MAFGSTAETAKLATELTLDDKLSPGLAKINSRLGAFSGALNRNLARGVDAGIDFAIRKSTDFVTAGIEALKQDKIVAGQTAAVIKSTGAAAGISADQVGKLADQLSTLNAVQDDVVQGAENVLLRFTTIGKDVFPKATQAVLDIAAATGTDASAAAVKLGKALNDPITQLNALSRVGITFTKAQKDQITGYYNLTKAEKERYDKLDKAQQKAFIKQHNANAQLQAQSFILDTVNKKVGGQAEAIAKADPGKGLAIAIEKLQKAAASGLLPVIQKVQVALTKAFSDPATVATITKIGDTIGGLFTDQNISTVASGLQGAASAVSTAIGAFNQLPPEIKALAVGAFALNKVTGGAVTGIAGAFGKLLGAGLQKIYAANVTVVGANVTGGGGGIPGTPTTGGKPTSKIGGLVETASKIALVGIVADVAKTLHDSTAPDPAKLPTSQLEWPFGPKNTPTILPEIFGDNGLLGGTARALAGAASNQRPIGEHSALAAREHTNAPSSTAKLLAATQKLLHKAQQQGADKRSARLNAKVDRLQARLARETQTVGRKTDQAKTADVVAASRTKSAVDNAANTFDRGWASAAATIVAGFAANRPIVNVTPAKITQSNTTINRYFPPTGSAGHPHAHDGGSGSGGP